MAANQQQALDVIDHNVNQITNLMYEKFTIWVHYELFSWRWWIGLCTTILPWIFWYFATKKNKNRDRFLFAGFLTIIIAVALDVIGDQYGLWHYRFNVLPVLPTYFPWDFTLMPVTIMFFLQIKPAADPFIKSILFGLLSSFAGEPFFYWIATYNPVHWRFVYSFPIQIAIYLTVYYFCKTRSKIAAYV
ncbi:CBO0543 family protein [Alicyclobacillus acidiphilus]|uniref:CBO0543 family protein n=1 Tax=Alicyclobacillus acidiphilus TaxID=182455 RepID=UPI000836F926|nr:CBO0543 family protein [Alicyclobacillus acidiphilus]